MSAHFHHKWSAGNAARYNCSQSNRARLSEAEATRVDTTRALDPALVSGITVEIGDKFLDYSVATQLKKLQALLKDGAYREAH